MSRPRTAEEEEAWQQVRQVVLKRDGYVCRDCGASRPGLHVHHLVRRADGGRDEVSNCIALCDGCHGDRHPALQVSLSRRAIERWALRLACFIDRGRELPPETQALNGGVRLFGVEHFRDGQLDAVLAALRGESLLVIRPTGAGKSLCFQLPAILKGQPPTFVLSPLKALMVDQVAELQRRKLPATFVNSDISRDEKEQRYELLEAGTLNFLYVAPERFDPDRVRPEEVARLARQRPSFLVVDEAHLVDRWGDDFRIAYSRIADIRRTLGDPPVLAFTATAGARTQERIKQSLGVPEARTLASGVDRPNIALIRMSESNESRRASVVAKLIQNLPNGRAMVFVPTTNVGRKAQEALRAAGCDLPLYHSKLPAPEREGILGRFTGTLDPPLKGVICTSAFSMGLDIPDVRVVVNWQHTAAVEDYLQEFGRAGRDGQPALALLLRDGGKEAGLLHWMANKTAEQVVAEGERTYEQAQEALRGKQQRINEMARLTREQSRCFRAELNEALMGPTASEGRSWALRILDWAFVRHTAVRSADACCDVCNPELVEQLRAGAYAPAARPRGGRGSAQPAARSTRRFPVRRTAAAVGAAGALLAVTIATASFLGGQDGSAEAVAVDTFERYTAAFSDPGEFSPAKATAAGDGYKTCADHVSDVRADPGRYELCLVIDPARAADERVTGGFKVNDEHGKHDCYGSARRDADCQEDLVG